jgi:hypothetical protein
MAARTISQIDNRIARLQALMKRLRAERRVAILREKHRQLKTATAKEGRREQV